MFKVTSTPTYITEPIIFESNTHIKKCTINFDLRLQRQAVGNNIILNTLFGNAMLLAVTLEKCYNLTKYRSRYARVKMRLDSTETGQTKNTKIDQVKFR